LATRASPGRRPRGAAAAAGRCAAAADRRGLTKLKELHLGHTQITDDGCAALAAALGSGALPALKSLSLDGTPASNTAIDALRAARHGLRDIW
jgi:hypothetical protein